ncbi:MAG: hypothetical protein ACRED3_06750 [Bradyrhizobium sp.]
MVTVVAAVAFTAVGITSVVDVTSVVIATGVITATGVIIAIGVIVTTTGSPAMATTAVDTAAAVMRLTIPATASSTPKSVRAA